MSCRLSGVKLAWLKKQNNGIVEPAQSPWAFPCLLFHKKGAEPGTSGDFFRLAVDFRRLNLISKPDQENRTVADIRWGFDKFLVDPQPLPEQALSSTDLDTIGSPLGAFSFNCLPLGVSVAPPRCAREMDAVLAPWLYKEAVACVDDILIAHRDKTQHCSDAN